MVERGAAIKRILKNILIVLSIPTGIFALTVIIVAASCYSMIPWHNLTLWRMNTALHYSVSHPTDSKLMEPYSFLGTRYTNTSECTYTVGEIRSTSFSVDQVLGQYENKTVHLLGFGQPSPVRIAILDDDPGLPLTEPSEEWAYDFIERIGVSSPGKTYYLVYLYEPGRSWFGDSRCIGW